MDRLRIIPLGGLGEIGKNMTLYELGDERILVDAGLAFPRDEHLGVDLDRSGARQGWHRGGRRNGDWRGPRRRRWLDRLR